MAPYRSSRTGARQTRTTQIDHDVFEGLPVRHWHKKQIHVNSAPGKDNVKPVGDVDHGYPELPLPRDYSMLPESSQILLRAARLGLRKRPRDLEDEKENEDHEAPEAQEESNGFLMSRWSLVPRDLEGPEPEYLAKRRKGLSAAYADAQDANTPQMRRLKVKKVDAEGNATVWEALVPEGQEVDGEIIEDDVSPTAAAPGTVVEGVGIVNADGLVVAGEQPTPAPVRRRPPIPKKKKKHGPGRGRKKVVEPIPGELGEVAVNGLDSNGHAEESKAEGANGEDHAEDSVMQDVNQEDEGSDEGSEEGDDDREEGELSPEPGELQASKSGDSSKATPPATITLPPKPDFVQLQDEVPETAPSTVKETPSLGAPDRVLGVQNGKPPAISELEHNDVLLEDRPTSPPQSHVTSFDTESSEVPVLDEMEIETAPASADPSPPPTLPSASQPTHDSVEEPSPNDTKPLPQSPQTAEPIELGSESVQPTVSAEAEATSTDITSSVPEALPGLSNVPIALPPRPATPPPQSSQHFQPPPSSEQPPRSLPSPVRRASNSNASPKAPTPSPPTPLQEAFAQGLSPKAPTMSPPTPIPTDDDLPEPPSFTLPRDQMITVGMDGSQDAPQSSIPGLLSRLGVDVEAAPRVDDPLVDAEIPAHHNPIEGLAAPTVPPPGRDLESYRETLSEGKLDVEAAPYIDDPKVNAEIPHDHSRIEGLRAPEVPPEERRLSRIGGYDDDVVRFSDGDEDLLGTEEQALRPE